MRLVEFLLARLAEDEAKAQAVQTELGSEREGDPYEDGSGIAWKDSFPSYPWGVGDIELAFMGTVGHPARVLAELEAKRKILWSYNAAADPDSGSSVDRKNALWMAVWHLADVYAEHPDYQPRQWLLTTVGG